VILDDIYSSKIINSIEHLILAMNSEDFQIRVSGFPYIVELIRRNLLVDLNIFSALAFLLFSIVILMIFQSWRILLGMIVTCMSAVSSVFMVNELMGYKIGILTANLATIIFVLTLSHIVFLTYNWKHLYHPKTTIDRIKAVDEAIRLTIPASFWSMFTTLLGFISLLFVQAKPLRELGICGTTGTILAFLCAYGIYPAFLRLKTLDFNWRDEQMKSFFHKTFKLFDKNYTTLVIIIMTLICFTSPSLWNLNTDILFF